MERTELNGTERKSLNRPDTAAAAHDGSGQGLTAPENTASVAENPAASAAENPAASAAENPAASAAEIYDHTEGTAEIFNNLKSKEFFDPDKLHADIHVLGTGAVGGTICELLARLGVPSIHVWDFDEVSAHNLGNQIFRYKDIGKPKVDAISSILHDINPNMEIIKHNCPITVDDKISGYIFLSIDNIDVRRELCTKWKLNPYILMVTDGRMRLTDGNVHTSDWGNMKERQAMIDSMDYTHEEGLAATPVSACGLTLSVVCTPRVVAALMVSNWIKFCNDRNQQHKLILVDAYRPFVDAY